MVEGTLRALVEPRRLGTILIIAIPLVAAQREAWVEPWLWPVIVVISVSLVAGATIAYRWLLGVGHPPLHLVVRLLAFTAISGIAPLVLWGAPQVLDLGPPLVAAPWTIIISSGLFWVGGYGLGRDIDLELGWRAASDRAELLSRQKELAELMAMRAQLDPHFLFNTLNAIAEWCREDPLVAERALVDLSAMLRDMLSAGRHAPWTLGDELALVTRLFELHRLRDPERFTVERRIDADLASAPVPPLLLLPLAENAMKHGPARGHRGQVDLQARRDGARIVVRIENPGPFAGRRAGGEGLPAVERRLAAPSLLTITDVGGRTRAEVVL